MIRKLFDLNYWKALVNYTKGLTYFTKGDYERAFNYFHAALKFMHSASPDTKGLCFKYMGICCLNLNRDDEAKLYLFKAKDIIGEKKIDAELSSRVGWVYYKEGGYLQAKKFYELAINRFRKEDLISLQRIKEILSEINEILNRNGGR